MRAYVDETKCIGCTLCSLICPDVFKIEDNKSFAYANPVPREYLNACQDAAAQCPMEAIRIR